MIDLLTLPLIAGLCIALMTGPLGCLVVWNKMAYFGDTLAHSALLGVVLALMLQINMNLTILFSCLSIALLLLLFNENKRFANDTLLGIFAHSSLAIGLVISSQLDDIRFDLMSYLFGDLLTVDQNDVVSIGLATVLVISLIIFFWQRLLAITVNEELAKIEGRNTLAIKFLLMALLAGVVAFAIKVVGVLLITALLIIPAASARLAARSPETMAMLASLISMLSVIVGLFLSYTYDSPAGPSIVLASFLVFIALNILSLIVIRTSRSRANKMDSKSQAL